MATSGHTVALSGATLVIVFLAMLLLPSTTLSSIGIASAASVFFTLCARPPPGIRLSRAQSASKL